MAETAFWHGSSGAIFKVGRRILYMITTSEPLVHATPRHSSTDRGERGCSPDSRMTEGYFWGQLK